MATIKIIAHGVNDDNTAPASLKFRVYSWDGTTATQIGSDLTVGGDVTVATDTPTAGSYQVTIDNFDAGTLGVGDSIKVSAVDADGAESVLSSAENITAASIIIFQDDFTGTTLDTNKWDKAEQSPQYYTYSVNNELVGESLGTTPLGFFETYIISKTQIDVSTLKVYRFDIKISNQAVTGKLSFLKSTLPSVDTVNRIQIGVNDATTIKALWVDSSGVDQDKVIMNMDLSTYQSFKVVLNGTQCDIYHWDGSAWVSINSFTHTLGTSLYFGFTSRNNTGTAIGDKDYFDNVYITNADYNTLIPS